MDATNNETANDDIIDFEKIHDIVAKNVQKILQNLSTMQRMEKQFTIISISPTARDQILDVRNETQMLINETEILLEKLYTCKDRDLKLRRNRLIDSFSKVLVDFQAIQRKMVQFEKMVVQHKRQSIISINIPSSQSVQDNNDDGQVNQKQLQIDEAEIIASIEKDHLVIKELEENIVDVNQIFSKLYAMVTQQATQVDAIVEDVEETVVNVEQASKNLEKASELKQKLTKNRCIFAIIILIIIIIVGLVIYFSVK